MTQTLKNFARFFPCTSDKSAVLLEQKKWCRAFFYCGSGRKHLQREQVFGGHFWCLGASTAYAVSVGCRLTVKASYRTVRKGLVMRRLCEEKALFGELVASGCYKPKHCRGGCGCFLKWWYPTTIGFPTKNDHFGVFWGYHHFRKHPCMWMYVELFWLALLKCKLSIYWIGHVLKFESQAQLLSFFSFVRKSYCSDSFQNGGSCHLVA